jgi:hypothetical protein
MSCHRTGRGAKLFGGGVDTMGLLGDIRKGTSHPLHW